MRFGIALPGSGPLADDPAVVATAQAAEQLDYASVWSSSLRQLLIVTAHAQRLPVGLLIEPDEPADSPALARRLGSRLRYVGARPLAHGVIRRHLPGAVLLDTSDRPPPRQPAGARRNVDGWSPSAAAAGVIGPDWQPAGSSLLLILRLEASTSDRVRLGDLRSALHARADEVVIAFPDARTLDEQLAGFADVAEQVAALGQPAG